MHASSAQASDVHDLRSGEREGSCTGVLPPLHAVTVEQHHFAVALVCSNDLVRISLGLCEIKQRYRGKVVNRRDVPEVFARWQDAITVEHPEPDWRRQSRYRHLRNRPRLRVNDVIQTVRDEPDLRIRSPVLADRHRARRRKPADQFRCSIRSQTIDVAPVDCDDVGPDLDHSPATNAAKRGQKGQAIAGDHHGIGLSVVLLLDVAVEMSRDASRRETGVVRS